MYALSKLRARNAFVQKMTRPEKLVTSNKLSIFSPDEKKQLPLIFTLLKFLFWQREEEIQMITDDFTDAELHQVLSVAAPFATSSNKKYSELLNVF